MLAFFFFLITDGYSPRHELLNYFSHHISFYLLRFFYFLFVFFFFVFSVTFSVSSWKSISISRRLTDNTLGEVTFKRIKAANEIAEQNSGFKAKILHTLKVEKKNYRKRKICLNPSYNKNM